MFSRAAFGLMLALLLSPIAWAENEGLADLDKATELKLTANNLQDLSEVIKLADAAITKGLDQENLPFAEQLLATTLFERASALNQAIFSDDGPDPRWQQLRGAAVADLERALKFDASQAEANFMMARLQALPGGNRERALRALTDALQDEDIALALKVKVLTLRGGLQPDEEKQLADYNAAIKLAPESAEAIRARGLSNLAHEKGAEAVADLKKAAELEPDNASTFEALGLALLLDKNFDEALEKFGEAIKLAPDSAAGYAQRARAYILKEDFKAAIEDLDQALKIDPKDLALLLLRARIHQQVGDTDLALADADAAVKQQPGLVAALRMRAEILAAADRLDDAIKEMEKLKEALPTNAEIQFQLALYHMANKQPRKAIHLLDGILAGNEKNWLALRSRADAHLSVAKQAEAIADYESALKQQPDNSGILNNLAWVLATSPDDNLRDGKRSIELATKACEVTEFKEGHILSTLAAGYAETGDFAKAREWSQKAVDIGKEDQKEQLAKELESYQNEKPWREVVNTEEKQTAQKPEQAAPARTADF